jgi:putative zinc finger protein
MKCEAVQSLIARNERGELSQKQQIEVTDHLKDCVPCREWAAFSGLIDSRMDGPMQTPAGLHARVCQGIATTPDRRNLVTRLFGDPTMKKLLISTSAITAIAAGTLLLVPVLATASTPAATFKAMRAALAGAAHSGELTLSALVTNDGQVTAYGLLDGQPLPAEVPLQVDVKHSGNEYDITITADLSPANYSSIKFGKDQSTLELTPKNAPGHRVEIALDPTTDKPKSWTTFEQFPYSVPLDPSARTPSPSGAWKQMSHIEYAPKATGKPAAESSNKITAHITMIVGTAGGASKAIKNNGK